MPKEISDALSDKEKKRQEVIYELIYTEKDFVNDLKYLNDVGFSRGVHFDGGYIDLITQYWLT